ncbi:MAG: hypothetical protein MI724_00300, partial [Spirochaetales bacterium]|nr:hypothetical protein [Spirochaetales bacterium]
AYRDAEAILTEHREQLDALSWALVEKETLSDKEIRDLFGFPQREEPVGEDVETNRNGDESDHLVTDREDSPTASDQPNPSDGEIVDSDGPETNEQS